MSRLTYVLQSFSPSRWRRQKIDPAYVVMQTRPSASEGLELIRPPVSYAQRIRPVSTSTAKRRPSVAPKKTVSSTTAGDDSTLALVRSCQTSLPLFRVSAVTVPSFELTMSLSPAIAGVDGFGAVLTFFQTTLPVSASIAHVSPRNVLT